MDPNNTPKNSELIVEIILAALCGQITIQQELELKRWLRANQGNRELFQKLQDAGQREVILRQFFDYDTPSALISVKQQLQLPVKSGHKPKTVGMIGITRKHWAIAATLFLMIFVSLFYMTRGTKESNSTIELASAKAVLKFSNGKTVQLKDQKAIVSTDGRTLRYADGTLITQAEDTGAEMEFRTPRGGQFNIILEDGTLVTLNAATTLRVPSKFASLRRMVSVDGEAFFEVAHDASRPFYVKSKGQQIMVLGTKFNVRAYSDETDAETTLVQGSVQIAIPFSRERFKLAPGQQAVLDSDRRILVRSADVGNVTAWRYGAISFDQKPFQEIMLEISRFYDIDIVYEGPIPDVQLFGGINHSRNLTTILHVLKASDVSCRLDGKKLIIENGVRH